MTREPVLVPTAVAAEALSMTEAGVRQLARRGKLTRYGDRRARLYDLWECRRLVAGRAANERVA